MKKLLIAAMAASLVLAFTGCGGDDESYESERESEATVSSAAEEDSSQDESEADDASSEESEAEESSSEESEVESSEAEESEAEESQADTGLEDGVFTGTGYTIRVNEELWTDVSESDSTIDCMLMYAGYDDDPLLASANLNIVAQFLGVTEDVYTPADFVEVTIAQYETMDGYEVIDNTEVTFKGMDANLLTLEVTQADDFVMTMKQLVLVENGYVYAISYGAEQSVFDSVEGDFNDIINSFEIV